MLLEKLKSDIIKAMKSSDTVKRDILRVVVSDCDAIANSSNQANKPVSDEQVYKIMKKLIESNSESLNKGGPNVKLEKENIVLTQYLPQTIESDKVYDLLYNIKDELKLFKSDGQAIGAGIKFIKQLDLLAEGQDVTTVVKKLRSLGV